jgi:hypothetical protein
VAGPEERRLTLAPATQPGVYSVTLTADAGPGRTASLTVAPVVVNLASGPDAGGGGPTDLKGLDGGLAQRLVAANLAPPARASRSSAVRTMASPASEGGAPAAGPVLAVFAALAGLTVWRFRARRPSAPAPLSDLAPFDTDASDPPA